MCLCACCARILIFSVAPTKPAYRSWVLSYGNNVISTRSAGSHYYHSFFRVHIASVHLLQANASTTAASKYCVRVERTVKKSKFNQIFIISHICFERNAASTDHIIHTNTHTLCMNVISAQTPKAITVVSFICGVLAGVACYCRGCMIYDETLWRKNGK